MVMSVFTLEGANGYMTAAKTQKSGEEKRLSSALTIKLCLVISKCFEPIYCANQSFFIRCSVNPFLFFLVLQQQ